MSAFLNLLEKATHPESMSPAEQEALRAANFYWDKVQAAFSWQFVDDMCSAVDRAWVLECEEYFARGFRLGIQLLLEALPHSDGQVTRF